MREKLSQGTFLILGDSLIAGYDWQARMPFFKVYTFGVYGEKVQDLLNRLPEIEEVIPSPDIILIATGISNVIVEDYGIIDILRKIITRLSSSYPNAEIIINSLPQIKISLQVDGAIQCLNRYLEVLSQELGCCYLNNFAKNSVPAPNIFLSDGIHLNDEAYKHWVRSFLEYVSFLLEEEN